MLLILCGILLIIVGKNLICWGIAAFATEKVVKYMDKETENNECKYDKEYF